MPEIRGSFRSFEAAERFFRQKVNLPTQRWDDLWQGQHARAFVVAGATQAGLLTDLREAVDAAISQGETLDDFRKRFDELVARNGWTGWKGEGSAKGRAWRTQLIYHQNLRSAYMAGRWESLRSFPYLKYQHNTVNNPREEHKAWDGWIVRTDSEWWRTHYPPNGWGCRCSAIGYSEARMLADGLTPTDPPPGGDGVRPEFQYHVGIADRGEDLVDAVLGKERGEKWTELPAKSHLEWGRPDAVPVDTPRAALLDAAPDPADLRERWGALYGTSTTLVDPSGAEVLLSDRVVEHWLESPKRRDGRERYLGLLREVIEQPFEIWVNFAQNGLGKVSLRRYYVKTVRLDDDRTLTLIAEVLPGGIWGAFDFYRGRKPQLRTRQGVLVWGRE
jgi:hypothetical protein